MKCTTIRKGTECPFASKKGCDYNGGVCLETVDACDGCNYTIDLPAGTYCAKCPDPAAKHRPGSCNIRHAGAPLEVEEKKSLNPIKASKRAK